MKRILFGLFMLLLLNGFAGELNLASFPNTLTISPWWSHSGGGAYKNVNIKEADKNIGCIELNGGEMNLSVDNYRYPPFLYSPAGRFCRFSVMAKGKGAIELSISADISDEAGKMTRQPLAVKKVELSESWQKIELEAQDKNPRASSCLLRIKFLSGEKALLTDSYFGYFSAPGFNLSIEPQFAFAEPGSPLAVRIAMTKDGKPFADAPVTVTVYGRPGIHLPDSGKAVSGKITTTELKTDKNGIIDYSFTAPDSGYGARIGVFSAPSGVAAEAFVLFKGNDFAKILEDCASSVKLDKPLSILIIGDSLSDFSRGYNYSDILRYCLAKNNPGMVKIKNAGVGGDFITRVWERISGEPGKSTPAAGQWRRYMYDGLFNEKPDIVLIFLGHNDTRSWSDKNFKTPEILPDVQYDAYCKLLDYIRSVSPESRIVLLSNVACCPPPCVNPKGKYCVYGIPEFMEGFNSVLKRLSKERGLDYIDIYTPVRDAGDRKSLFLSDGVHLSPKGNQLAASVIVKYFAEKLLPAK